MRMRWLVAALFFVIVPAVLAQPTVKPACDRACLENYIDRYLDAMIAHEASPDLFHKNCRFTENGIELPLGGEGLWYGMSGKGTYKFYVPDVETQQVAFIGTVREGGAARGAKAAPGGKPASPTTVGVAIRLKIVEGLITEAEQLVIRPEQSLSGPPPASTSPSTAEAVEKMGAPHEIYSQTLPEAERKPRAEQIEDGKNYFTGLQRNDGKGYYPFTDDCVRYENGKLMTTECKKQFESGQLKGIVTRIRDRRFVAVDRERGNVYAFGFFDHLPINWTWQLAEIFKIEKGQIRRIEAIFHRAPYGINSGWSTYEQGMSEELQSIR